ncbi:ryncolin-1-like [Mercenaria mercenaria]|uniref:ryncolin-1-like n=1 Tax=Mercenaria mercenaria TaxID=6596 RepID=UPI00234F0B63|nr:ryncolin-1-like [Mercenaria mercenaria]
MDETMASLKSLDYMEFVVNVLNATKTNMAISQMCTKKPKQYSSCKEILSDGFDESGGYVVYPSKEIGEVKVYCDQVTDGGGWTVFQRRLNGSVSFYRNWSDYKSGFGDTEGEFWLGNDVIHTMLSTGDGQLRIELENFEGSRVYAEYDKFSNGDESSGYKLEVGRYSDTAGNSLSNHNGMKFSTVDRDNDIWSTDNSCAKKFKGCWWYRSCYRSNLNGVYHNTEEDPDQDGIVWSNWKGFRKSMKFVEMEFR